MPDLDPVVIDHPLSTISEPEIDARAAQAAEQAALRWLGSDADKSGSANSA
ncbi:MAG: hypothetical protein AB7T18_14820 [Alphaproteobacteria bacterium]